MKTILISTSALWNCGDDFIREGVLRLLDFRDDVCTIWWNRGFGISPKFANSLDVNLPHADYILIAGTPQWIMLNERLYEHALTRRIPIAIIGVGTRGYVGRRHIALMKRVAQSGLCEIALARDPRALEALKMFGFDRAKMTLDPAFFCLPDQDAISGHCDVTIIGWRDLMIPTYDPRLLALHPLYWLKTVLGEVRRRQSYRKLISEYDTWMVEAFNRTHGRKIVLLHDNREISRAKSLFGPQNVMCFSDYRETFKRLARSSAYIGSRLHGAIPSVLHGVPTHLVYLDKRWEGFVAAIDRLRKHSPLGLGSVVCSVIGGGQTAPWSQKCPPPRSASIQDAISAELKSLRSELTALPILGKLLND